MTIEEIIKEWQRFIEEWKSGHWEDTAHTRFYIPQFYDFMQWLASLPPTPSSPR